MPYVEWRGNKCRVRWDTGRVNPETGKKIYDSQSGFDDEEEAFNYGLDRESDVRNGRYIARRDGSMKMGEWCDQWLQTLDLRPKTMAGHRSHVRAHIKPQWESKAVNEVTPHAYQVWEKQLKARLPSAKNVLTTFRMIMDEAVENKMIDVSPVPKKKRGGRYVKKQKPRKRDLQMLTVYRLARNAYIVWGYTGWVYIWTAAFTGMRPAEMYGLQRQFAHTEWPASDPDHERREEALARYGEEAGMPVLRVQFQQQHVDGASVLVAPKYDSWRSLVIPPFLADMHAKLLASHESRWVFPALRGGQIAGPHFSETYWQPIRDGRDARVGRYARPEIPAVPEMAGLDIYRLRHGHKEWLDEDGHPRVAVEARMGHELGGVEGVYANVTVVMERRIMESLQARWERFVKELKPEEREFISHLSPS